MVFNCFINYSGVMVTRYITANAVYNDETGYYEGETTVEIAIDMSIQPTNERERYIAEEGIGSSQILKIYTNDPIVITDDHKRVKGDEFIYEGRKYVFYSTAYWKGSPMLAELNHYKNYAVLSDTINSYVNNS